MNIKTYLENKISYSWYKNTELDYGITGKFLDCVISGVDLIIFFEENDKKYQTTICHFRNYTLEQIYNIWMEFGTDEEVV